jgi:hypothetical protein
MSVLAFDYDIFHELLVEATRAAFRRLQRELPEEAFYVYALQASADHSNVCIYADTEEQLSRLTSIQQRKHATSWYAGLDLEALRRALRYGPNAYLCPSIVSGYFADLNAIIAERAQILFDAQKALEAELPEEEAYERFAPHRRAFVSVCVNTLKQLEAEGLFGRGAARHQVLVSFLSGEIYHEAYLQYGLDLNPPQVIERFLDEMVAAAKVSEVIQENMLRNAQM